MFRWENRELKSVIVVFAGWRDVGGIQCGWQNAMVKRRSIDCSEEMSVKRYGNLRAVGTVL
jgi:hypothetical protein